MNQLLSICIPTYNRSLHLKECLNSIILQAKIFEIPIYISDNASTDDTLVVLQEFREKYPFLFLRANSENIGFDCNLFAAVEMASSQYIWSFSDDDIILPNTIEKILTVLNGEPEVLFINYQHRSFDLTEIDSENDIGVYEDQNLTWENSDKRIFKHLSFVGSLIIKKCYWCAPEAKMFIGSGFIHTGVAINAAVNGEMSLITTPLIWLRRGSHSWLSTQIEVLYTGWCVMASKLTNKIGLEEREIIRSTIALYIISIPNLMILRSNGGYRIDHYFLIKNEYKRFSKLLIFLISIFPPYILKIGIAFYKNCKSTLRKYKVI